MSPGRFRPAGNAALRLRQPPPFGGYLTTTISTPTATATTTATEEDETESPTTDANPYYSYYSKYASDYSEYADYTDYTNYHHATSALPATMTATMTVTGANSGTTSTSTPASVYDHGNHNDGASSGIGSSAIAGIAVGSVLGVSVVGALLVWFCLRGRQSPKEGESSDEEHDQERSGEPMVGPVGPAGPVGAVGAVGPSVYGQAVPSAAGAPRLPSPFRQRQQHNMNNMMHMQTGSDEEMVAFAKATNTAPARPTSSIDEDPPSYEEAEGHRRAANQPGFAPLLISPLSPEFAAGSVSDGFRRYHEQPVDTESKPYDHLGMSN